MDKNEAFFLATMMFTDGVCPYCKMDLKDGPMLNPQKAIKHLHDRKHEKDIEQSRGIVSGM